MYLHENNSKKSQKALKKLGRSWGVRLEIMIIKEQIETPSYPAREEGRVRKFQFKVQRYYVLC
jgi:hypothetical protein